MALFPLTLFNACHQYRGEKVSNPSGEHLVTDAHTFNIVKIGDEHGPAFGYHNTKCHIIEEKSPGKR